VGWHAIEVPLDEPAIAMAVGGESLVVSLNNGLVLRWGREFFGNKEAYPAPPELGVVEADLFPAKVASICGHIEEGTGYGCLLTDSGEVWCAGENNNGELGNGTSLPDPTLTKVLLDGPAHGLSCGRASGCALLGGKKIACWGSNDQMFVLPGAPTGNQLLPVVWDLPVAASRIDVTGEIACALGEDGGLWCWGAAFPLEDVEDMPAGQPFEPYLMPIPSAVVDFDIGSFFHSCILAADKQLYCYGHNGFGQIEPVPAEPSTAYFNYFHHVQHTAGLEPTLVRVGLGQTCIALQGGGVRCWGKPKNGQLGTGGPNATISAVELMAGGQVQGLMEQVVDLSISSEHSCALTISGKVYCWGINYVSQCGWPAIFEDFTPVAWEDVD
jgi:alpha-tubulin suppressor-like RCC1 family protein